MDSETIKAYSQELEGLGSGEHGYLELPLYLVSRETKFFCPGLGGIRIRNDGEVLSEEYYEKIRVSEGVRGIGSVIEHSTDGSTIMISCNDEIFLMSPKAHVFVVLADYISYYQEQLGLAE
jgi:hypothetical protein